MTLALHPAAAHDSAPARSARTRSAQPSQQSAARSAAEEKLVHEHLPLVGHLVREVLGRVPVHVTRDDLMSAGLYALAASAQAWESDRGVPFGRFAAIRIRGAITDELRSRDWASRSVRGKAREVEEARCALAAKLGRSPSRQEVAAALGMDAVEVSTVEADVRRAAVLSLQSLTPGASDALLPTVGDHPETLLLRREQIGYLRDAVAELPERLRTVVIGHFFEQRKMVDIAEELGVTESRISQLRTEALGLLHDALRSADGGEQFAPATVATRPTTRGAQGTKGAAQVTRPRAADSTARRGTRAAARDAYCAAVAARSNTASRLAATTLLGERVDGAR